MYLNAREQQLLDAAREVIAACALGEHGAVDWLAEAISVYDAQEATEQKLKALPAPAIASILPDRMYSCHLWVFVSGGLYPAHQWSNQEKTIYGPNDLHLVKRDSLHQFCIDCCDKMFQLDVREQMVSEAKLKELQA